LKFKAIECEQMILEMEEELNKKEEMFRKLKEQDDVI